MPDTAIKSQQFLFALNNSLNKIFCADECSSSRWWNRYNFNSQELPLAYFYNWCEALYNKI